MDPGRRKFQSPKPEFPLDLVVRPILNPLMFRESHWLATSISLVLFSSLLPGRAQERLTDFLEIPPAMASQSGNPKVMVESGKQSKKRRVSGEVFSAGLTAYQVRVPEGKTSRGEVRRLLAREILSDFYQKNLTRSALSINEKRLKMAEIIPMNREIFMAAGMNRLRGERAPTPLLDAWWKTRMGMPLHPDRRHQLIVVNLHADKGDGKVRSLGHFCFGYRERGGAPQQDTMFDFRAPWYLDRKPGKIEALNLHNRLKLEVTIENLYDWLYTQTEFRNCLVKMWFIPVYEEQFALLRDFARRGEGAQAGNFRAGKKNCASLGARFFERILPIRDHLEGGSRIFDFPVKTAKWVVKCYPPQKTIYVKIDNVTQEHGHKPTYKSEIHAALPSRSGSRCFRLLAEIPGIN